MGGAKLAGDLHLGRVRVDRDDRMGRTQAGTLQDVETDSAATKDHDALAGANVHCVDRGADTGGHGAADEGGYVKGDVLVDGDQGFLGSDGVLRKGRMGAELTHHLAVPAQASAAVGHGAVAPRPEGLTVDGL